MRARIADSFCLSAFTLCLCLLWVGAAYAKGPNKPPGPPEPPQSSVRNVILMIGDGMGPEQAMLAYAGIGGAWPALTNPEKNAIDSFGEMGISDVLSARIGVSWNGIGMAEGDHTLTKVPVFAGGPGSELFDAPNFDNTDVGRLLFDAVSGN